MATKPKQVKQTSRSPTTPKRSSKRSNSNARGYTYRWSKASKIFLASHPWCVACCKEGRQEPATEVDHVVAHRGNEELFWDESNWQGLCHRCHSQKTAREDGAFGRASKTHGDKR